MSSRIVFRLHAIKRMFERGVTKEDVKTIIRLGYVIAEYPSDTPYPSRLIFGFVNNRPLHVALATNEVSKELIIITVYEPTIDRWEPDFKRRKKDEMSDL